MVVANSYLQEVYQNTPMGAAWFSWYDFPSTDSVLIAGDVSASAKEELAGRFTEVVLFNDWKSCESCSFSAILICGGLGTREDNEAFLYSARMFLAEDGVLLWAADNKLGVRFLCGDVHFGDEGQFFTYEEWKGIFQQANMPVTSVYGLMPGWHLARNVFADEWQLNSDNIGRLEFHYVKPDCMFGDERELLSNIAGENKFSKIANAFLWEYKPSRESDCVLYADMYADKDRHNASVIMFISDGTVVKKPLFTGGTVEHIYKHSEELHQRGLKVVQQKYACGKITMPFLHASLLTKAMAREAARSAMKFQRMLMIFWQCILSSSEHVKGSNFPVTNRDLGPILSRAYLDMVPRNAFLINDEFVFFDQEYCYLNYPAKFIMYRSLVTLYGEEPQIERFVPLERAKEWFELCDLWDVFYHVDRSVFIHDVRQEKIYAEYQKKYGLNNAAIIRNKKALSNMDILGEYDLFAELGNRSIILFGAGGYADMYLQLYGNKYKPAFILDNDKEKWHKYKEGIPIFSPEKMKRVNKKRFMVIICSRCAKEISKQLQAMGIEDYKVY